MAMGAKPETPTPAKSNTLLWLLGALVAVVGLLQFCGTGGHARSHDEIMRILASQQRSIFSMLKAWAPDNDDKFPNEPVDANANFRTLFKAGFLDDEKLFAVPQANRGRADSPDNDIGNSPDFLKALEPGELSTAYVSDLTPSDDADLPILISGIGPLTVWITGKEADPHWTWKKSSVAVTFVGGLTEIFQPDKDGKVRKTKNGKMIDIFSAEWGTKPGNIRLPASAKH